MAEAHFGSININGGVALGCKLQVKSLIKRAGDCPGAGNSQFPKFSCRLEAAVERTTFL